MVVTSLTQRFVNSKTTTSMLLLLLLLLLNNNNTFLIRFLIVYAGKTQSPCQNLAFSPMQLLDKELRAKPNLAMLRIVAIMAAPAV